MLSLEDLREDPAYVFGQYRDTEKTWIKNPKRVGFDIPACDEVLELDPKSILDVGCFTGYAVGYFRFRGFKGHYTGIDINRTAIEFARERFPEEVFAHRSVDDWTVQKHDVVFASRVIIHSYTPERMVERFLDLAQRAVVLTVKITKKDKFEDVEGKYGKHFSRTFTKSFFKSFGVERKIEKQGKYHTIVLWNKTCH